MGVVAHIDNNVPVTRFPNLATMDHVDGIVCVCRFGGALDGAARQFTQAYDSNMIPMVFVNTMRKQHQLIMGIGHKVKSVSETLECVQFYFQYINNVVVAACFFFVVIDRDLCLVQNMIAQHSITSVHKGQKHSIRPKF